VSKGYFVSVYRTVHDPEALSAYAALAAPAIQAAGGRFIARGTAVAVYEAGIKQRTVVIEFDSVAQAIAAYESAAYQAAVKVLGNAVEREIRIVEGV